jgi:hypothetical protein
VDNATFLEIQKITSEAMRVLAESGGTEATLAGISDALGKAYSLGVRSAQVNDRFTAENAALRSLVADLQEERAALAAKLDELKLRSYQDSNLVSQARAKTEKAEGELLESQFALMNFMFEGIVRQLKNFKGGEADGQD